MVSFGELVLPITVLALGAAALGAAVGNGPGQTVVVTTQPSSTGSSAFTAFLFLGIVLLVILVFGQA